MILSSPRFKTVILLAVVTPLGFAFKHYSGIGNGWFNNYGAGALYVVFWILIVFLFFPSRDATNTIPIYVLSITCILEILQLWHPPLLEAIRSFYVGKALLGTTFVWWDFPHYFIGCMVGWWTIRLIVKREKNDADTGNVPFSG
jgi:hypothetical protein